MAADVDHDGDVTQTDAQLIINYHVGVGTITQSHVISVVPDDLYYLTQVEFI